jgi:hypothetical protein
MILQSETVEIFKPRRLNQPDLHGLIRTGGHFADPVARRNGEDTEAQVAGRGDQ